VVWLGLPLDIMKTDTIRRLLVVVGVTLIALWLIYPTIHYFLAVSGRVSASPEKIEALRARSVPLGLDLQGGVDVLLAVDSVKTRQAKVEDFADQIRRQFSQESPSIDATVEVTSGTSDVKLTLNSAGQERAADNILTRFKNQDIFRDYRTGSVKAGQPLVLTVNRQLLEL
jgi:preprotein translocase subunit SecD